MTTTIRAADALAQRLYAAGCRVAFGMPGGEVLTIIDALEAAGIQFVLAKHENAAAFMAEGAWHRTGAPGILVATVGPGALNGVNAVANAHQDRVPLIVIAGAVDADEAQSYTHQVLDQTAVFTPITKASFTFNACTAHIIADKAVSIALEGRPGPVHIDLPIAVAVAQVSATAPFARAPAAPVIPAQHVLDQAADWLSAANRPVIIAGLDAVNEDAAAALTKMAKRFAIPVVTTYKAKGLLPEDHALSLGGAGLSPLADTHLLPLIKEADLIICAGYDPIEMRPGWQNIWDASQVNVIDITAVPNHHYMHQATLNIIGNTPTTLNALNAAATPHTVWADGQIKQTKSALAAAFPKDDAWGPAAVVDVCRDELPRDTLATVDSGAHRILLSQMWECYAPRGLMQSSALCTMGCAIPLAIGAHFIEPDRTVVSFCGDAGFLMVAGELTTAKELNLNTIFVVFVDASLALIELKQRQRQLTNNGVDFAQYDFAAMGKAFGGNGHTVHTRDELRVALKVAQKAQEFTVIAAVIEKGAYDGRI